MTVAGLSSRRTPRPCARRHLASAAVWGARTGPPHGRPGSKRMSREALALTCAPFGLGFDRVERRSHCLLPGAGDAVSPQASEHPEVGAQLALPGQPRAVWRGLEQKRLDDVGDRPAHETEIDAGGALEAH